MAYQSIMKRLRRGSGEGERLYGAIAPRSAPAVAVAPVREDLPPADQTPVLDPGFGVEILQRAYAALEEGDWEGAQRELEAVTDPDQRLALLRRGSDRRVRPGVLDEWVAGAPEPVLALLVRAAHAMWHRDAGIGAAVERSARLEAAEADLRRAAELAPRDAVPWCMLLYTGLLRGIGASELREGFAEVEARVPELKTAELVMVAALLGVSGGGPGAALDFARERAAAAAGGDLGAALIVIAHHAVIAEDALPDAQRYLRQPQVQAELRWAAEHSVLHPAAPQIPLTVRLHGYFAYLFELGGDPAAAARHFVAARNRVWRVPWSGPAGEDPIVRYRAAQDRVRQSLHSHSR